MKRILAVIAAVLAAANLSAQPKAVIFDTDWWTDVDDACAIYFTAPKRTASWT